MFSFTDIWCTEPWNWRRRYMFSFSICLQLVVSNCILPTVINYWFKTPTKCVYSYEYSHLNLLPFTTRKFWSMSLWTVPKCYLSQSCNLRVVRGVVHGAHLIFLRAKWWSENPLQLLCPSGVRRRGLKMPHKLLQPSEDNANVHPCSYCFSNFS